MTGRASASVVAVSTGSTQCLGSPLSAPHWGAYRCSLVLGFPGVEDTDMLLGSRMHQVWNIITV